MLTFSFLKNKPSVLESLVVYKLPKSYMHVRCSFVGTLAHSSQYSRNLHMSTPLPCWVPLLSFLLFFGYFFVACTWNKKMPNLPEKSIKVSTSSVPKQISMTNSSSEVYYGGAPVGIPFSWESQPGTPRVEFRDYPLPPLTPPPSYLSSSAKKPTKKESKHNLFHNVLPKLSWRKTSNPPSPSSSFSSSPRSRSRSVPSSPLTTPNTKRQSNPSLAFHLRAKEEDQVGSPVSTLCFGFGRGTNARSRGFSSNIVKVLLGELAWAIVNLGSLKASCSWLGSRCFPNHHILWRDLLW